MNINWCPSDYAHAAILAEQAGEELLARLDWMTFKPQKIVDVGCGIGLQSESLKKRYPDANIFSLDSAIAMLTYAREQRAQLAYICGDNHSLPFANQSIDLVLAHFFLPWQMDFQKHLREWRRVLRKDGICLFTVFGPDTLKECENGKFIPRTIDMHDLGDLLLHEKFIDPVLDVDYFTLSYRDKETLNKELYATGWLETSECAPLDIQSNENGKLLTTYEVVYGHAFAPGAVQMRDENGTVSVPVSMLRR